MDYLLLGSGYFKKALEDLDCHVVWAGDHPDCDLRLPVSHLDLPKLLDRLPSTPRALILTDDLGRRVFPSGLDRVNLLKVWYAVDSPLNAFWQREYAALFDLVVVDQKDGAAALSRQTAAPTFWLPVAIDTRSYQGPPETKRYDLAFVGTVSQAVRPKRTRILAALARRYRLVTAGDRQGGWIGAEEAARLYRRSSLVLNENLFDGVTTRMLEGMASGSLLLTEDGNNGLEDLFQPGEHLATYGPETLYERIDFYLSRAAERERMASQGHDQVLSGHDIRHRARRLLELMAEARPSAGLQAGAGFSIQQGKVLFLAAVRWPGGPSSLWTSRALTLLGQTRRLGAADPDALLYLGMIHQGRGEWQEAVACFTEAAEIKSLRARLALAYLSLRSGDQAAARAHFHEALTIGPRSGEGPEASFRRFPHQAALSADQHLCLGLLLEAAGYDLTPGFVRGNLEMGLWNAFEHFLKAVQLDAQHGPALARLGRLLMKHGAYIEAHPFLARAAALNPASERLQAETREAARKGYLLLDETAGKNRIARPKGEASRVEAAGAEPAKSRITLSLCMILKDEAHNLPRSLGPIHDLFDDVVVVDTGSQDATPDLARSLGARVIPFAWQDDFSAARNASLRAARGDWILWLDGDNCLDPQDVAAIRRHLDADRQSILWCTEVVEPEGEVLLQKRVFPNRLEVFFEGAVHEQLVHPAHYGQVLTSIRIVHWGYADKAQARQKGERNLRLLLQMVESRPADLYLCYQTGKTLLNLRRFDQAAIWLGRAVQAGDQADRNPYLHRHAHVLLAQALDRLGRPEEAEACLRSLIKAEPGYGPAHYSLGRMYYARHEYAPAAAEFTTFLGQGACDPIAGLNQGRLRYSAGLLLGRCLERSGRPLQAAAAYQVSTAADPGQPEPLLALARLHLTQGRREEATSLARRCLEIFPRHRRARALLDEVRAHE